MGGFKLVRSDIIEYVTFSTTGNALNFGDLLASKLYTRRCSSNQLGFYFGGGNLKAANKYYDDCEIMTTGDSIDFGDLHTTTHGIACIFHIKWSRRVVKTHILYYTKYDSYITIV